MWQVPQYSVVGWFSQLAIRFPKPKAFPLGLEWQTTQSRISLGYVITGCTLPNVFPFSR
jgi:hypothetical protein